MPNSNPCDGIFNQHLTTIKDSYVHFTDFIQGESLKNENAGDGHDNS